MNQGFAVASGYMQLADKSLPHDFLAAHRGKLGAPVGDFGKASAPEPLLSRTTAAPWKVRRKFILLRKALLNQRLEEAASLLEELQQWLPYLESGDNCNLATTYRDMQVALLLCQDRTGCAYRILSNRPDIRKGPPESRLSDALRCFTEWKLGRSTSLALLIRHDHVVPVTRSQALVSVLCLCVQSAVEFAQMRPPVSARFATEALSVARKFFGIDSAFSALPATLLAQAVYEQGSLDEAEGLIRSRLAQIRTAGFLESAMIAYPLLARTAAHRGDFNEAVAHLDDAQRIAVCRGWPALGLAAKSERAKLSQVAPGCALEMVGPFMTDPNLSFHMALASAQLLGIHQVTFAHGPASATVRLNSYPAVLSQIYSAANAFSQGDIDRAQSLIVHALQTGITRGLFMVFLDGGPQIIALLRQLYALSEKMEDELAELRPYVGALLRTVGSPAAPLAKKGARAHQPLSPRERSILSLMCHGHSNKMIARSLGIAPETVKSHAKSIFIKLGARTRAQSVAKAEMLRFF